MSEDYVVRTICVYTYVYYRYMHISFSAHTYMYSYSFSSILTVYCSDLQYIWQPLSNSAEIHKKVWVFEYKNEFVT